MKESTTRVVLLVAIMAFGTVMLILDIPFFYLLVGAVVLAILVLLSTGTVRVPSLKRKEKPAASPRKQTPEKGGESKRKAVGEGGERGASHFFSSLKRAFAVLRSDFRKGKRSRKEEEARIKKIDTLLEKTIQGEPVTSLEDIVPEAPPAEREKKTDPFASLVGEDLNPDLLNGMETPGEFSIPGDTDLGMVPDQSLPAPEAEVSQMDIALSMEEEPISLDETNDADEVKEILEAHKDDIGQAGDIGVPVPEETLEGLESIDIEGIDIGEEEPEGTAAPSPAALSAAPLQKGTPASPTGPKPESPPQSPAPQPETEMISFGSGKREDDDLMASLKSEAKAKKKGEYASLIRDLKDIRVDASELQKELESLLSPRKPKDQ
ncbi:MAG: hypothetical protein NQU46_04385 [Methanolinea sp.]|nr:hypothetical protein [Methanolinea sp.]